MSFARAALYLCLDHIRRILRDGVVLRSLVFPIVLVVGSVVATVGVVLLVRPPVQLAVTEAAAHPDLLAAVKAEGYSHIVVVDPEEAVRTKAAAIGTDGVTLWVGVVPPSLEQHVRAHLGTVWRPDMPTASRVRALTRDDSPRGLAVFLGVVFVLYGVVFGAGGIARDRDEGTLDAELSIALPHVLHGLARWVAASVVLGGFFAFAVALIDGMMGLASAVPVAIHGVAAIATSAAIGIIVVGRSGLDRGFAGPMAMGLVGVFFILGLGLGDHATAPWLPIASLVARSAPLDTPVAAAVLSGLVAAFLFARRSAVQ